MDWTLKHQQGTKYIHTCYKENIKGFPSKYLNALLYTLVSEEWNSPYVQVTVPDISEGGSPLSFLAADLNYLLSREKQTDIGIGGILPSFRCCECWYLLAE